MAIRFFYALLRAGFLGDPQASVPRLHLLVLRFAVAAIFFRAFQTLFGRESGQSGLQIIGWQPDAMFAWYRPFAEAVIVPHTSLVIELVMWGELAVCVSLVLGLLARPGALLGMVLTLNVMFATGMTPFAVTMDSLVFWSLLTLFLTAPGRVLGIDAWLHRRVPAPWMA